MSDTKKKIGLFTCVATGIGAIIGSGIFGSLPAEINEIGDAVVIAFILATIYKLAASFLPCIRHQLSLRPEVSS